MNEKAEISFEDSSPDDPSPFVVLYNPRVLPLACKSQVMRFGVVNAGDRKTFLSGKLKGDRKEFVAMIQSYGVGVEVVRARSA